MKLSFWHGLGVYLIGLILAIAISGTALGVRFDYTLQTVMLGSAVLGLISGVLGSFSVLRQQSLVGDTLSHAALPGVVIAFMIMGRDLGWLLLGAGIAGWLGVMLISSILSTTRIKQDAAMGIILATFFGFGIALLTYNQGREDAGRAGLDKFIFGQAAAMSTGDIQAISVIALLILAAVALFWKEFKLISFDTEFASTNGYPVRLLETILSTLTVLSIVLGLRLAGVILMVAMLIAPAVAARQWTDQLGRMVILSGIFGLSAGVSGAVISAVEAGLPTGPLITVVISIIVFVSMLFATERGILWTWWQQRQDRRRFASETILQDMARLAKRHHDLGYKTPEGMLISVRGQMAKNGLTDLATAGMIQSDGHGSWSFTDKGRAEVEKGVTHDHA